MSYLRVMTSSSQTMRCVIGFDYVPKGKPGRRFDAGDPIVGLPTSVVKRLASDGVITVAVEVSDDEETA